ncbi:DNA -binding domain-containing protein [Sphingomonas koreensis]|uniref:DNA -binding domain-containing protein n=1 Tax=Sphingomonas koreensis TaxID=93064 RepID=UPI00387E475B
MDRGTDARLLPLRRLAGLFRTGRFLPALFPREHRVERLIDVLRVHDALSAGASQRDIATGLFGPERIPADWRAASDSLRSRVRRLVRDARHMAAGGYRGLLRR